MTLLDKIGFFTPLDAAALLLLFLAWLFTGWAIEHPWQNRPAMSSLMAQYRREWMRQLVTRQPRIFDSQILATLRQGASFFASATMIAIGGVFALLGNAERLVGVANDLTLDAAPVVVWEAKILVILIFLANAFLKFVWSHRLFGYCAVIMAAVPNDAADPLAHPRAAKAADINITATRGFNRGLRSLYFALAAAAWMLGAYVLIAITVFTVLVLLRREFASHSRAALCRDDDDMGHL